MSENYISSGRKKQKQRTRSRILESAKKFMAEGRNFTLDEIAADSQISRATVYRYFSNVELLTREATLDVQTKKPTDILAPLKHLDSKALMFEIQSYYNKLTLENETAFRKYLSVLSGNITDGTQRAGRRNKTLRMALRQNDFEFPKAEVDKLIHLATILMGIEPMIVAKDVCRLNNKKALETLSWGLEMILLGIQSRYSEPRK